MTLLSAQADVNAKPLYGAPPLVAAAGRGNVEMVRALLEARPDVNAGFAAVTSLMLAASNGHLETVLLLLAANADVTARQTDGATALTLALRYGHSNVAQLLQSHPPGN